MLEALHKWTQIPESADKKTDPEVALQVAEVHKQMLVKGRLVSASLRLSRISLASHSLAAQLGAFLAGMDSSGEMGRLLAAALAQLQFNMQQLARVTSRLQSRQKAVSASGGRGRMAGGAHNACIHG